MKYFKNSKFRYFENLSFWQSMSNQIPNQKPFNNILSLQFEYFFYPKKVDLTMSIHEKIYVGFRKFQRLPIHTQITLALFVQENSFGIVPFPYSFAQHGPFSVSNAICDEQPLLIKIILISFMMSMDYP